MIVSYQDEDDCDVSKYDSIIDRMICERNNIRVKFNTMVIIENLPITNTDFPNNLLSRLPIRDNYVVSSLTGWSGKGSDRHKSGRDKSMIDKIKNLLNGCGSPSQ